VDNAEEPAVEAERGDVQVGTLSPPLRQDLVQPSTCREHLLISGQEQYSGAAAARMIIEALGV
jgi:hypothetical protein